MFSSLVTYREKIEQELCLAIERMGEPSRLRDACAYALLSGGKRLRPALVYLVADALNQKLDVAPAALSVEYFHTASLIADDLPCMDNDDVRRNRPSLHKAFDESTALLASYTLVSAGYAALYEMNALCQQQFPQEADAWNAATVLCLKEISAAAGLRGATMGQFLDMFPPDSSYETIRMIIVQKTATLFEIAFVLGWLFGKGNPEKLDEVKQCARHLGVAFQIADDCHDFLQDHHRASKINIALALGYDRASQLFREELQAFVRMLRRLGIESEAFQKILQEMQE